MLRVRNDSISELDNNNDYNDGIAMEQIPEDEKVNNYSIGVHNHDNFSKLNKNRNEQRRNSYSLNRDDFESDVEHRRYIARKRWRKVKIFMKAMYKFSRRETYHHVDSSGSVFWKIKLLYSLPQFSLISLTMLINIQVIVFYNEIGVSLAFLSFFQIFARSFDVLTDPMMAHISDNLTRTKYGRRIPWMMIGAPFYAIAFFILMSPPTDYDHTTETYNMSATYWFGASYILFYLCDTVANIPLLALGPELSDDSDHRTSLFMWVKLFEGIGTIVGGGAPVIFISGLGMNKKSSFQLLAFIFGSWYVISMFLLIRNVKEREQSLTQQATPFVASISRSFRNIAFRPLAIAWVLDFCALAMLVAVLPFFIRYYLNANDPDAILSIAIVGLFLSGFASIPIWKIISNRGDKFYQIGKRNAWLLYNLCMCLTNFLFIIIAPGQSVLLICFMCLNGIPIGGQFLIMSIVSDVIDYDEFLNFSRNEGAFTVFSQFVPKLVAIPAQSFPLIVLFMLGYKNPIISIDDDGNDITEFQDQNKSVRSFLRIMFAVMPTVISCISFIIKQQYFPIKNHSIIIEISDGITKHMQGLPAIDPITKQQVVIEEYNKNEQYIVDLFDHFTYSQIIWLLEPNTILKKHNKNLNQNGNNKNRRMSFQAISNIDFDVKHFLSKLNTGKSINSPSSSSQIKIKNNSIAPDINRANPASSEVTSSAVRVVKTADDTIETSYFKSMGKIKGVEKIKWTILFWIMFGILCVSASATGVAMTIHLLHDVNYAFIPALFCLCIGTSSVFTGFNILKFRAARKLEKCIKYPSGNIDLDDLLKRVLYPKIKGQRGGGFVWSDIQRTQIDVLAGDLKTNYNRKLKTKKLKKFQQRLFQLRQRKNNKHKYNKSKPPQVNDNVNHINHNNNNNNNNKNKKDDDDDDDDISDLEEQNGIEQDEDEDMIIKYDASE